MIMQAINKKWFYVLLTTVLGVLLLAGSLSLAAPRAALAVGGSITIEGDGVNNPGVTFTQDQLRNELPQHTELYSTVNTWPTKNWYRGTGVKVSDLLAAAGGIKPEATLIKFIASDGFTSTFTVQELFNDPRYRFPHFMDNGTAGHIPGDPSGAVAVEPIIAHQSCYAQSIDDVMDPDNMNRADANHLLFGQRAVTEQTNALFAKYVTQIEVLTTPVPKWGNPTATPDAGSVPAGTMVELHGPFDDIDKVHYTTDGSEPTLSSPMYNWIASRWWSSRQDVLDEINQKIGPINGNTTIKAIVIGPGRSNSDVVSFSYVVPAVTLRVDPDSVTLSTSGTTTQAIYATVDPPDASLSYTSSNEAVATVSSGGIITAVGTGGATITVTATKAGYTSATANIAVSVNPGAGSDTTAPTWPAGSTLTAAVSGKDVNLSWPAATDDVGVTGYLVYQDTSLLATVTGNVYQVTGLDPGSYTFSVKAVDAAGNESAAITAGVTITADPEIDLNDPNVALFITGNGVAATKKYTLADLEAMPQKQVVYSAVNTWPTKKWYVGKGVRLSDLLDQAGMSGSATMIKFTASDSFTRTLTVQELLREPRYCFPNFKSGGGDGDGHIPGDPSGAYEVEPILALVSAEGSKDPGYMNDVNALLLMLGQRAVTEQTGELFIKNTKLIEVLTTSPSRWDNPQAEPGSGTVAAGTKVKLSNAGMDNDKIHYTTDGSTPTINSPMYNWVARRWWSARGDEVVNEINHPIEITKDTTIKAVTIGPGKENSDVVTFTYKVQEAPSIASGIITPEKGGTVSLGNEVTVEAPPGAVRSSVEVKIERVTTPPAAPAGFKLLGSGYEISVVDQKNYSFTKSVTIKLIFDPQALGPDETPAVHYYDEAKGEWVNLGGTVSGNYITVQVDHLTKFAVMVALPNSVTVKIKPAEGGTVSLNDEAVLEIPAGALAGAGEVEVKIERLAAPPAAPAGFKLVGNVYEFSVGGKSSYKFAKPVTIKLSFDPDAVEAGDTPAIHCYDEARGEWTNLGGTVSDNYITVEVDHFTRFAVLAAVPVTLADIAGHWAEAAINQLVAQGAVSGYPDGTFQPDNTITRAEFATVLVKAFKLKGKGGQVFADISGHWAADAVAAAVCHGIVRGYDAGTFAPDDLITREQMATMIVKAIKLRPVAEEPQFADTDSISEWAREAVATATKNGIMKGYPNNTFQPQGNATRAEAVTVILNALQRIIIR